MNHVELVAIIEGLKNGLVHAKRSDNVALATRLQSSLEVYEEMLEFEEYDDDPPETH